MAAFTSVPSQLSTGLLGTKAGVLNLVERGYTLADATAIPVGRGLVYDSSDASVQLPSAGSQRFMGVAVIDPTQLEIDGTQPLEYVTGQRVLVATNCPLGVWVKTTEAVDPSDAVYLQHTANGGREPGTFRTDSDSSNADLVDGANVRWGGAYSSGLALLLIGLP